MFFRTLCTGKRLCLIMLGLSGFASTAYYTSTVSAQDYSAFCSGDVSLEEALRRGQQAAQLGRDGEAKCWLRKAGEQADPSVKFKMAMKYAKGNGIKQDLAEADYWLKWSASEGFSTANGYLVCSTPEGRATMLDLSKQCWDSPAKQVLREFLRIHCHEDQVFDAVQDVDVILRANDPSIFRCKVVMSAHVVDLDNSPKPPDCVVANRLPTASAAVARFDLVRNNDGSYKLVIHDDDEEKLGACRGMSATFRPSTR